jgi:hypothetical protein
MTPRGHQSLPIPAPSVSGLTRRRLIGRLALAGVSAPIIASILRESSLAQEATPEATRSMNGAASSATTADT